MAPTTRPRQSKHSEQYILNASFDEEFELLAFETLVYDPLGNNGQGSLNRVTNNALGEYGTNDVTTSGAVTYIGKEDPSGSWFIQKVDESSGTSIRYATIKNNGSITSYSNAWTDRGSLTYETYGEAF